MKNKIQKENGYVIVEATVVYPIAVLIFFVIFYAAVFLFQRARLQAGLENALLYYKSEKVDSYISMLDKIGNEEGAKTGNQIQIEKSGFKNPYGDMLSLLIDTVTKEDKKDEEKIEKFLKASYNIDADVELDYKNLYFVKKIEAKATMKQSTGINIAWIGASNHVDIVADAKLMVVDGDNFIGDADFVVDLISKTAVGEKLSDAVDKITKLYGKMKDKLGVGK